MEQKLGFLRKYKRNAQLISCHEINKLDSGKIPNSWYELFQEENVDKRVEKYFIDMERASRSGIKKHYFLFV